MRTFEILSIFIVVVLFIASITLALFKRQKHMLKSKSVKVDYAKVKETNDYSFQCLGTLYSFSIQKLKNINLNDSKTIESFLVPLTLLYSDTFDLKSKDFKAIDQGKLQIGDKKIIFFGKLHTHTILKENISFIDIINDSLLVVKSKTNRKYLFSISKRQIKLLLDEVKIDS